MFQVVEEKFRQRSDSFKNRVRGEAGCFDGRTDAFVAAGTEQGFQSFRLGERFAAAGGHASSRGFVKFAVLEDDVHNLLKGHFAAALGEGVIGAGLHAGAASGAAFVREDMHGGIALDGVKTVRAGFDTGSAQSTEVPAEQDLRPGRLPFGIGAPETAQRAALKEDDGAYAGTIVDAVFLNIENAGSRV